MSDCEIQRATGDGWELRLGDCLDPVTGLASLDAVDHTVSDPPYREALYANMRTNGGRFSWREQRTAHQLAARRIGGIDEILDPCASHFLRMTRRWIALFSCEISMGWWIGALGDAYRRWGGWVKTNPTPQISGDRPGSGIEPITLAHARNGRTRWNGGGKALVYRGPSENSQSGNRPDHPCPKPLWLMEALILDFTDPGDIVCDPFAGSGTTPVACLRHGRRFIGWEKDPDFFDVAARRIGGRPAKVTGQEELFG